MSTKISRDDKIAAKDFLKAQVKSIDMKGLSKEVREAATHILDQFDKWYLDYAPVKAAKKPTAKKTAKK